jgi:steroid 5-alpha reductase family enzyme
MTWKRAELVTWLVSGVALAIAVILFARGDGDGWVMLFVVISLGTRLLFELVGRLMGRKTHGA